MKHFLKNNMIMLPFFASAVVVLIVAALVSRVMVSSANMIERGTEERMLALSEAAALLVTAEELDEFLQAKDMEKPEYAAVKAKLDTFTRDAGIVFTYYMRLDEETGKMQFIVDNVTDPAEMDGLTSELQEREEWLDAALATGKAQVVDLGSYSDGWDGLLTAWMPLFYQDGTASNIVAGVDMQDEYIKTERNNTYILTGVLVAALMVVLLTCFWSLSMYRQKARQAEQASMAKSTFLSSMSHEMRTPMNAIIGLGAMARKSGDMEEVRGYLDSIETSSQHLRQVIDNVLDISKIESGKVELELVAADLRQEINSIAGIIRTQAEGKNQTLAVNVEDALPQAVHMDTTHLRQVAINLLSNAVKFTPAGGAISMRVCLLEQKGGLCNIEWRVKDNGIGIDGESQKRLFRPFVQGDVSTTRKYGGTGLGLAISKQLVELMGGDILLESAPGQGSEFIFNTWLRAAAPADVPRVHAVDGKMPDLSGKTVLLVEDSEINQLIAIDMLNNYGAVVDTAGNGREGVEKYLAAPSRYALVFMDIQMPEMDGYTATRTIRASGTPGAADVPIIAMTANVFKEDVDKAFASGMDYHVKKPFEEDKIRDAIFAALAEGRQKAG